MARFRTARLRTKMDAQAIGVLPTPPLKRVIYERDKGPFCERCGSSFERRFFFFRTRFCINPKCNKARRF